MAMSPLLTLPTKLRSWLCTSPSAVSLLVPVTCLGLGAPRSRRLRTLSFGPALLGLVSLGVLGWRASQARASPTAKAPAPRHSKVPFAFNWQMSEEIAASAASGH